jgi:hypothetical protein
MHLNGVGWGGVGDKTGKALTWEMFRLSRALARALALSHDEKL